MSASSEASPGHAGHPDDACDPVGVTTGRIKLRALVDVMFGGAALALLLMWLVLSIAGRQLT
jgi:hypothetical protein